MPNSKGNPEFNEREVTDPVTHLPILIHDSTSVELENIPPHPSKAKDPFSTSESPSKRQETSEKRHEGVEQLVHAETQGWWEDKGDKGTREKIDAAMVAVAAALLGGTGSMLALSFLSAFFPEFSVGWIQWLLGFLGCIVLSLGACFLFFGNSGLRTQFNRKRKVSSTFNESFDKLSDHQCI